EERPRTTTDEEIQAAMDFISRDLQQAAYIYDAEGMSILTGNNSATICTAADAANQVYPPTRTCSQIPIAAGQVPVLAFWKRTLRRNVLPIAATGTGSNCTANPDECDDSFVYSLVVYYLMRDASATWSSAARVGRWELSGGVLDKYQVNANPGNETYVQSFEPDAGFAPFDLSASGSLAQKLNRWQKDMATPYPTGTGPDVLIDYVDFATNQDIPNFFQATGGSTNVEACPTQATANQGDGDPEWLQVPAYQALSGSTANDVTVGVNITAVPPEFQTYSFYACVNTARNTARVFLRGNAFQRVQELNLADAGDRTLYERLFTTQTTFFPEGRIEVQGTGALSQAQ
ncbi:MAG: hypothetical protein HC838_06095, partial [Spirulinaceae cyanobacterium RM2_2_10]|nr:hypothetical protein [Spirulinaceae cyanobacterium RM2_2_10]